MRTAAHSRSPLWLALRLPHLPLEVFGHSYNSELAVIIDYKRLVYHCSALALAEGVTRNMSLSTAQALCESTLLERDLEREQQALQNIAHHCYHFTPYIEFHDNQGLLLEVSRSLKLFRGLEPLVEELFHRLRQLPYHVQPGLGHTGKAAWLLSWQSHPLRSEAESVFRQRLSQIPIEQLHAFPDAVKALQQSGFRTLGDVVTQTSANGRNTNAALTRRLGSAFTDYLDEIFGCDGQTQQGQLFARPPATFKPDEIFQDDIEFDYPISNTEQLREPMRQLLQKLIEKLVNQQQQCHSVEWRFYDIHQNSHSLTVNTDRIHNQWQLPLDLTMIQLEQTDLPFEVDTLELMCHHTTAVAFTNNNLLGQNQSRKNDDDSERLFARLAARLGETSLHKISYQDDPLPEMCQKRIKVTEASHTNLPPQHSNSPRPAWLFDPPQTIQQHQQQLFWHGPLDILQGPERLQGHWWDTPTARDYFMAQRNDFLRCWIYQDLKSRLWYVHGVF